LEAGKIGRWEARMLEGWDAAVCLSLSATLESLTPWTLSPNEVGEEPK